MRLIRVRLTILILQLTSRDRVLLLLHHQLAALVRVVTELTIRLDLDTESTPLNNFGVIFVSLWLMPYADRLLNDTDSATVGVILYHQRICLIILLLHVVLDDVGRDQDLLIIG